MDTLKVDKVENGSRMHDRQPIGHPVMSEWTSELIRPDAPAYITAEESDQARTVNAPLRYRYTFA